MPGLDGSVKLPGVGTVPKKQAAVAGGVVAAIVGVGYYRKRQTAAGALAAGTDSGMSAEGTGALGDTSASGPGDLSGGGGAVSSGGDNIPAPIVLQNPGIVSNQDWKGVAESQNLGGIDSDVISAAVSKVLGGSPVTQAENEIFNEVCGIIGYPPQGYPPIHIGTSTPGTPVPPSTVPPKAATWSYTKQTHQISTATGVRALVQRFSSPGASGNQIESALRATVNDPANRRYRSYYGLHGGKYPAKASVTVTVAVKK